MVSSGEDETGAPRPPLTAAPALEVSGADLARMDYLGLRLLLAFVDEDRAAVAETVSAIDELGTFAYEVAATAMGSMTALWHVRTSDKVRISSRPLLTGVQTLLKRLLPLGKYEPAIVATMPTTKAIADPAKEFPLVPLPSGKAEPDLYVTAAWAATFANYPKLDPARARHELTTACAYLGSPDRALGTAHRSLDELRHGLDILETTFGTDLAESIPPSGKARTVIEDRLLGTACDLHVDPDNTAVLTQLRVAHEKVMQDRGIYSDHRPARQPSAAQTAEERHVRKQAEKRLRQQRKRRRH